MQLKRDTEYAMQIMVYVAECQKEKGSSTGVSASEVIAGTRIPRVTFRRISGCLEEKGLIRKETDAEGGLYICPGDNFWGQSLLSVAEAVEGNMQIFIIFNRETHLVRKYGSFFRDAQKKVSQSLSDITMDMLTSQAD